MAGDGVVTGLEGVAGCGVGYVVWPFGYREKRLDVFCSSNIYKGTLFI